MKALFQKNSFCAIEHLGKENSALHYLQAKKRKDEFEITDQYTAYSIEEVSRKIGNDKASKLIVSGSMVITKMVAMVDDDDSKIILNAYPNLDIDEFYFQILRTSTRSFVSICRKQYIENLIQQFKTQKIYIVSLSLGSLEISNVLPFLKQTTFNTSENQVSTDGKEVVLIEKKESEENHKYNIGGEIVEKDFLIPLAGIFGELAGTQSLKGNFENRIKEARKSYHEIRFFQKGLVYGIGVLIAMLCINFLVFNHQYRKKHYLSEAVQVFAQQQESIEKKKDVVAKKEAIVQSILDTGFSKSSLYMSELVRAMPQSILLETLVYQPVNKAIKNDKPIQLEKNTIHVKGESFKKSAFTDWLNKMGELVFVDKITIVNYGVGQKASATFELLIKIRNANAEE